MARSRALSPSAVAPDALPAPGRSPGPV